MTAPNVSGDVVELWFLRHAHAGDPAKWKGDDAVRPLSARGRAQTERLAGFLADHGQRPDLIVSSPRLRATQTAEVVAQALELEIRVDERLAGPLDLAGLEAVLTGLGGTIRPVMLVGHDPDFSGLVSDLTGAADLIVRKGALARVDAPLPLAVGGGTLVWLIPPLLLEPAG